MSIAETVRKRPRKNCTRIPVECIIRIEKKVYFFSNCCGCGGQCRGSYFVFLFGLFFFFFLVLSATALLLLRHAGEGRSECYYRTTLFPRRFTVPSCSRDVFILLFYIYFYFYFLFIFFYYYYNTGKPKEKARKRRRSGRKLPFISRRCRSANA